MKRNLFNTGYTLPLARYLSPLDVWAIAFGCIVGWGAFVMPGTTFLPLAGPLGTVIALSAGTLLMLIIGRNFSYLMEKRPGTGGLYTYTKEAFGRDHAFLCSWFLSLSYISIVFLNATALLVLSRTVFGNTFQFGFHYEIAGFEIYLGEILLSVAALAVIALIFLLKKPMLQYIQTSLALILFIGVIVIAIFTLPHVQPSDLLRGHTGTDVSLPAAVMTIVLLAPWAFVGFDTASLETSHFRFPVKRSRHVISVSIICGGIVYAALSLVSIAYVPKEFSCWQDYFTELNSMQGVRTVPTFFSADSAMGKAGLILIAVTAIAAIFTGIIASYRASARILSTMAEDKIVPHSFLGTTVCILFIMLISIAVSFLGRNALNWFVDLTSLGAIVGFGYTSAAARKLAVQENKRFVVITGSIGTVISGIFALVHLLSKLGDVETMQTESFLLLAAWCMLGYVFYWRTMRLSELSGYNGVVVSSSVLFCVLLYAAVMWYVKSILDAQNQPDLSTVILRNGIIFAAIAGIGVALMLYTQSALRARHNRLQREKIHAEESSKAKSQFLFNISHDIRTPMNAILGYTHVAREEENLPDNIREYLEKIDVSGQHLLSLLNDTLDMSLIESGKLELHSNKADLCETVHTAYDMFRSQMSDKGIDYKLNIEPLTHSGAVFDRDRLLRVLLNLLSNACKFTPEGGAVSLSLRETDESDDGIGSYELCVRDNGIGMTKAFAENVFEAFARERTATVSRTQGTGLGMAISKSIVDAMGGTITVDSAPGEGAAFTVTLPLQVCEIESPCSKNSAEQKLVFSGRRVLLADDMEINRQIAVRLLERLGITTDCAENGQQAVEMLQAHSVGYYDAVLMDIQMPVMDGFEAAAAIRALENEALRNIPILAVTANASGDDTRKAAEIGMNGHIAKPINPTTLALTLKEFLR